MQNGYKPHRSSAQHIKIADDDHGTKYVEDSYIDMQPEGHLKKAKVSMAYFDTRDSQQELRRSSAAQLYKREVTNESPKPNSEFAEHEAQYATSKSYRDWVAKKAAENRLLEDKASE